MPIKCLWIRSDENTGSIKGLTHIIGYYIGHTLKDVNDYWEGESYYYEQI